MIPHRPDLTRLLMCAKLTAQAMGQLEPTPSWARAFLEALLFEPQSRDGRELWACFTMGLITGVELRNAVMSHLATWIAAVNAIDEPSSGTWSTAELENSFDAALFATADARLHSTRHIDVIAAVEATALAGADGALLRLHAERGSVVRLREAGASDEAIGAILLEAIRIGARILTDSTWARTTWDGYELALRGTREALCEAVKTVVARLVADPSCGRLSWRAILTRIFTDEAIRTLHCDPEYDLAALTGSGVVWVEPYPGDDWQEPQRYPTTLVIWHANEFQ